MSKEEILKPYVWDADATSDIVNERDALNAMDEYAQHIALNFAKWVELNYKFHEKGGVVMKHCEAIHVCDTLVELYDKFKSENE